MHEETEEPFLRRNAPAIWCEIGREMMKKMIIAALLAAVAGLAFAHSGGTNKQGCHTNHKTGEYHCH